ncbi:MAG TPA: cyclodeaminase/cyclohydrolase family protein [Planctomycetota bacterium]|nr:cyclodeaminase/cyclohydrolase family protein [Planctomycetota bacterium]HRR79964.1 cyclodeaminase/cyclohydrolase family protein [Planctomycetota bacterium]HRT95756.1 cyclodeaminase/cyclohydrolase family protein [Planctomycetota bacterium]
MYRTGPLEKYVADAAAGLPAPGGGSVSALAGALGAAMAAMAAHFTVGRKKFAAVEPEVRPILQQCEAGCRRLVELMDRDVEAYGTVSAAYGLPRDTDEQKAARTAAIQNALQVAMAEPLATFRQCRDLLRLLDRLVETANPNLISDVGVAAILLEAALRGAKINVEINLAALKDQGLVAQTRQEIDQGAAEAASAAASVLQRVYQKMGWPPA